MMKSIQLKKTSLVLLFTFCNIVFALAQINFDFQSNYKYLKGNQAIDLGEDWVSISFDDASWAQGAAPFHYGDGEGGTELNDMQGNYSTVYMRSTFEVAQADLLNKVKITADWDDGFILFINGVQILNENGPETISYDALATELHEYGELESFTLVASELGLVEGENTIAVLGCNITLSESSDFYFDMKISAMVEQPELIDSVGVTYSHVSGFHDSNFNLQISTPVEGASVIYTLDGSNPQTSFTSIVGDGTVSVEIDPNSTSNRGTTPGVVVRASIIKEGYMASKPLARTFIYLDKVPTQTQPGWDWPTYDVNGQHINLDVDTDVSQGDDYGDKMHEAMLDIPSISVVTDNANLFDAASGIYVNAENQGYEWERECSVELLNPDENAGFNINAGLRIRGGWSRHDNFAKHAFRLFFREEYGASKLYYPLFGDEGTDRFDKVDLRCAQNYSWANSGGEHNTFVREVFLRDAQRAANKPYTRSRYYHLYLNGMYWGIFQTQERSEARYAEEYFGGDHEEYDVIKISGENYSKDIVATDGNLDKWEEIYDLTKSGFSGNANYFKLEGKNPAGEPLKNGEILVDIDNLITYMLNIIYAGNYDSPVSAWGGNKNPNNMYAITNREDKSQGFKFLIHDGEHSLMTVPSSGPGIGLYENRADIGQRTGDDQMEVWSFTKFHSQWLHETLSENEEYRMRFADEAYKQLNGNGIFTPDACVERFNDRAEQIDMAIIGESARWGDTQTDNAYTKDNAWIPELDVVRFDYFPYRTDIVIDQLKEVDLYTSVMPPVISIDDDEILESVFSIDEAVDISFTNNGSGTIYYTLTGKDPRMVGGDISSDAHSINSGEALNIPESAIVKARVLSGSSWSAIRTVSFVAEQTDFSAFKVTELHYHPLDSIMSDADTVSGKSYEFIEFKNTGAVSAINLSGVVIDSAINYTFPENTLLAPQAYFVVAAKPSKFYDRYGFLPDGNFSSSFSNGGEQVLLTSENDEEIMDFTYSDQLPWSERADGEGPSLVSVELNPQGDPNNYAYWTASALDNGSPGKTDLNTITAVDEGVLSDLSNTFDVYPNPTNDIVNVNYLAEGDESFELSIYSVNGALINQDSYSQNTIISLNNLNIEYGVYVLSIKQKGNVLRHKIVYTPY